MKTAIIIIITMITMIMIITGLDVKPRPHLLVCKCRVGAFHLQVTQFQPASHFFQGFMRHQAFLKIHCFQLQNLRYMRVKTQKYA
jgi:hypothetical protein